jgi:NAD(P)-dependent dehydrogenase (short-subunit alcohol dehydrogenase family)
VSHNSVVDLADKLLSSHQGTPTAKKIDVVIHNAGFNPKDQKHREAGYFESTSYISQFSASNVGESILINSLHPMELTGRLFPMLANDAVVIAISSWLGSISTKTIPGHYGYAGSKALMNMLIKGMSVEFSKDSSTRRTAVALNPGWMKTDMGGPNADTTPVDVAARIFSMIDDVDSDDDSGVAFIKQCNGKFINTDRTEHEW